VTVTFQACPQSGQNCSTAVTLPQTQFSSPSAYTLPSVWDGWIPGTTTPYNYVQLSAMDEAGNTATTSAPTNSFNLFNGSTKNEELPACTSTTCTYLANGV
jgi:hypothetical protein